MAKKTTNKKAETEDMKNSSEDNAKKVNGNLDNDDLDFNALSRLLVNLYEESNGPKKVSKILDILLENGEI